MIKNGWLFSVSGCYAVEIKLKSGRQYQVGTDAPNELEQAIKRKLSKNSD